MSPFASRESEGAVLSRFPKTRPPLPPEHQKVYAEHYRKNRDGAYATTSLSSRLESWMHVKVAADLKRGVHVDTLEIGAGTLNQLNYEPHSGTYDIVEPYPKLFEGSPFIARVARRYDDIADVPIENRYDRITSTATFEHILDLPAVVARAALLLKPGGTLRVGIPNEGKFPWRLGTYVTGLEYFLRFHLNYQVLQRYEHVNTADEIETILSYFFEENRCDVFGLTRTFALYRFIEARSPRTTRAAEYLRNVKTP